MIIEGSDRGNGGMMEGGNMVGGVNFFFVKFSALRTVLDIWENMISTLLNNYNDNMLSYIDFKH